MQYQNADTKSLRDMVYISVDLEYLSNKLQMVEVNLWALGQEGQVPGDGIIRRYLEIEISRAWAGCHKQGAIIKYPIVIRK